MTRVEVMSPWLCLRTPMDDTSLRESSLRPRSDFSDVAIGLSLDYWAMS